MGLTAAARHLIFAAERWAEAWNKTTGFEKELAQAGYRLSKAVDEFQRERGDTPARRLAQILRNEGRPS